MIFNNDREELRQLYYKAWQKLKNNQPLDALEREIAAVIMDHPEYHQLLENPNAQLADYLPELGQTNPFLHMGLHLAIREQVQLDRPSGIRAIFQTLIAKQRSPLAAEHEMMDYLVETLWQAQRHNTMPEEQHYLSLLQKLIQ